MRNFVKLSVLPVAALAVACGRGNSNEQTALSADLQRDLAAATASSVELASTSREYQPARFVSAMRIAGNERTGSPSQRASSGRAPHGCDAAGSRQGAGSGA